MCELDFYRRHSPLTHPGVHRDRLQGLPADVAEMAAIIGGVMVHRDETVWRFGFELPEARRVEAETRYVEAILDRVGPLDKAVAVYESDPRLQVPAGLSQR
jgi:hypothetical protein